MKSRLILFAFFAAATLHAATLSNIVEHLQAVSVTIRAEGGGFMGGDSARTNLLVRIDERGAEGSGILFTRTNAAGDSINFVWTAGHVVAGLRSTREIVAADGAKKTVVEFKDAKVVKVLTEDGRSIGRLELDAEVLKYSDADTGRDLALLRVRKKNFVRETAKFYLDRDIPPLGVELFHVGSLLGQVGANSLTAGIISQHGRLIRGQLFDQVQCTSFPGSSGGGVELRTDARVVGLVLRGAGEGFTLIVPAREIALWAKRNRVEWAMDHASPLPSDDEIAALPVEDISRQFSKPPAK